MYKELVRGCFTTSKTRSKMSYSLILILAVFTNGLAVDSDTCIFVSTHQKIHSMEYENLLNMTTKQCLIEKTTEINGNSIICDGEKYIKPICFCADINATQDLKCKQNQYTLCCDSDQVACFNGGQVQKESNCSSPSQPIIKCKCTTVLTGAGRYQGDRCQYIPVIRKCNFPPSFKESYNSCDDGENFDSLCIYNNTFVCGPAQRNIDGKKRMVYRKCENRNDISKQTSGDNPTDVEEHYQNDPSQATGFPKWAIIVIVAGIVIIIATICFVMMKYWWCRRRPSDEMPIENVYPLLNENPERT